MNDTAPNPRTNSGAPFGSSAPFVRTPGVWEAACALRQKFADFAMRESAAPTTQQIAGIVEFHLALEKTAQTAGTHAHAR